MTELPDSLIHTGVLPQISMINKRMRDWVRQGMASMAVAELWPGFEAMSAESIAPAGRTVTFAGQELWVAFLFGLVFLVTRVVLALWLPHPSKDQEAVFRTVLSLAAAGMPQPFRD